MSCTDLMVAALECHRSQKTPMSLIGQDKTETEDMRAMQLAMQKLEQANKKVEQKLRELKCRNAANVTKAKPVKG